jgi:hypothetical protein
MTAPHDSGRRSEPVTWPAENRPTPAARHPNEGQLPARRDDPAAPSKRTRRAAERQPRTYTSPELPARRQQPRADEQRRPTLDELDRWDEEWRDEWDRGEVDDSAAYEDDQLDVAEQTRDVEWLLDALDALDDEGNDDDAFDWE